MRKYSWGYGLLHWFVHYFLAIMLVSLSGIVIIPVTFPIALFGIYAEHSIFDYLLVIAITSLIDLDHIQVLNRFGMRKYILAQKRLVSPFHNFFFLSAFSIASAISAIFFSKALAVMIFIVVLHLLWDIVEDVAIFGTSFRRWEDTWGLKKKDIEEAYDTLIGQREFVLQPKPERTKKRESP
jgi:hypothetical protein